MPRDGIVRDAGRYPGRRLRAGRNKDVGNRPLRLTAASVLVGGRILDPSVKYPVRSPGGVALALEAHPGLRAPLSLWQPSRGHRIPRFDDARDTVRGAR
jgi:hypothetical protein